MKNMISKLLLPIIILQIVACGGGKKALISQADINSAKNSGTLASLYDKSESLKLESRGSSKKELIAIQSQIASLLVEDRISKLNATLANKKTEYGQVDLLTLNNLNQSIDGMKQWDSARYELLMPMLRKAIEQTNSEIANTQNKLKEDKGNIVKRLAWQKKIAILSGKNSQADQQFQKERLKSIEQLSTQSRDAFQKRMFNMALASAKDGNAIDPGNIQFESLISRSEAALFEQAFQSALENGKPESAYQLLLDIADKPIMLQIKKKMKRSISVLANYFANNAQASYKAKNLYKAYMEFKRGRDVQNKLSLTSVGFIQEKAFLDIVMEKADGMEGSDGAKYGLYGVVKEFDPGYPLLEEKLTKLTEVLSNRATTKLAVSEFREVSSASSVVASVGRRVGSKLEKILFEKLGGQLQIVTSLVNSDPNNPYAGVALAIDGEVLQAAIETSKNQGQRSINVQTGINQVETEAYVKWKKRKRGDKPIQYNSQKIMEDVTIRVEHIKKIAVVEVAYRIVEPATQKVLLTNNLVKEAKHLGDSTNEFQKGTFHQPYIEADLPSDIKIMDNLASEVSKELGQSLLNYLAKPEQVFFGKYQALTERGELVSGIEMLSNAVVMAENKKTPNEDWITQLKKLVLEK